MAKLQSLVRARFGKEVQVRFLANIIEHSDPSGGFKQKGSDLILPLYADGLYLTTAVIKEATDLSTESRDMVVDLIRLILEPSLKGFINELSLSSPQASPADNIIQLVELDEEVLLSEAKIQFMTLQSISAERRRRVAVEIHDFTENWVFLEWQDIQSNVHSLVDLADLGRATIFVSNLAELSAAHLSLLKEFIDNTGACSDLTLLLGQDLRQSEPLSTQELPSPFDSSVLAVDNLPLDRKGLREVLELLF